MQLTPGIRYMLLSTLAFAGMHSLIKSLASFHVFQIIFFRSLITAGLCVFYLQRQGRPLLGKHHGYLILRALFGLISMTLFFITLQRMPMGASVSLKYLSPLFTAIFATFLLKERISTLQWSCFVLALCGVLLLKGFDLRIDFLNLALGITGAAFGGLVYVVIRKIGEAEHPLVVINYFMLSAAVITGLAMIPVWKSPTTQEWMLLAVVGSIGFIAQVFMTKSLQIEPASRVAPIKYVEVIYSLLIGLIWFDEGYSLLSLLGIGLILTLVIPYFSRRSRLRLSVASSKKS